MVSTGIVEVEVASPVPADWLNGGNFKITAEDNLALAA